MVAVPGLHKDKASCSAAIGPGENCTGMLCMDYSDNDSNQLLLVLVVLSST